MLRTVLSRALRVTARPSVPLARLPLQRTFAALAGGSHIDALAAENPNLDLVRYEHKNRVWTTRHIQYYSEALAIGFLEMGFTTGDVVLSWLPDHFSEQMVLQFACSKSGMILYSLDPSLATENPEKAKEALKAALKVTNANILISPEAANDVNYVSLAQEVIPELRIFDAAVGQPFMTPRFPHLRTAIHTGFDQDEKQGWYPLRHMVVPSGNLDSYVPTPPSSTTPLAGELTLEDNIPVGVSGVLNNAQVVDKKLWPTYCSILEKKFQQVDGVGVVF